MAGPDYDRLVELHKLMEAGTDGLACELYDAACAAQRHDGADGRLRAKGETHRMFIAMNRFRINQGHEADFENVWRNRDSKLGEVPGFREFHLLRGKFDEDRGTTLYASHTLWESHAAFIAWTKSEHFRQAHRNAGDNRDMYDGHPQFEGFEAVEGM